MRENTEGRKKREGATGMSSIIKFVCFRIVSGHDGSRSFLTKVSIKSASLLYYLFPELLMTSEIWLMLRRSSNQKVMLLISQKLLSMMRLKYWYSTMFRRSLGVLETR